MGQQSILHAVQNRHQRLNKSINSVNTIEEVVMEGSDFDSTFNSSGSKPMNETLTDLPLEETDKTNSSTDGYYITYATFTIIK